MTDESGDPAGPAPSGRTLAIRAFAFGAGVAALLGVAAATGPAYSASPAGEVVQVIPSPSWNSTCCSNESPPPPTE
ncbi:hypothetical protein [Phytohabitans rumicis]|uniref:Uncharacterized protein n=1 Tax=Phytohabitans rumicis TaxID=1076125 RepID=A0A6V8LI04_9ACTN|nr:hypothetical protein [Phytohabitans rumicis]GFJ93737.1 hypothetical protein Prum_073790 [Phytohabitans rumicis]